MPEDSHPTQGTRQICDGALRFLRSNLRSVLLLVATLVFLALLSEVLEGEMLRLDSLAYGLFVEALRSDAITPIMEGFTSLASVIVVIVMTLLVAVFAPGRAPGWCAIGNLAGTVVLNVLLKSLIQRPRPDGFRLVAETGYSFPSGHSMVSMAFFGLIIWMVWRYHRHDVMRYVWCALFAIVIVMVGISRIYLGVHYASDVIAGFCVSLIWLTFYTRAVAPLLMPSPEEVERAIRAR